MTQPPYGDASSVEPAQPSEMAIQHQTAAEIANFKAEQETLRLSYAIVAIAWLAIAAAYCTAIIIFRDGGGAFFGAMIAASAGGAATRLILNRVEEHEDNDL